MEIEEIERLKQIKVDFIQFCLINKIEEIIKYFFLLIKKKINQINLIEIIRKQILTQIRRRRRGRRGRGRDSLFNSLSFSYSFDCKINEILYSFILSCYTKDIEERIFLNLLLSEINYYEEEEDVEEDEEEERRYNTKKKTSNSIINQILENIYKVYSAISLNNQLIVNNILQTTQSTYPILHIIDENGWNLLHHATYHNVTSIIELLVSFGISFNSFTKIQGQTPLQIAAASLHYDSIITLKRLGAKLKLFRNNNNSNNNNMMMKSDEEVEEDETKQSQFDDQNSNLTRIELTPLQTFINTFRFCNWIRRISPHQILQCLHELSSNEYDIWNYCDTQLFISYVNDSSLEIPIINKDHVTSLNTFTIFTIALGCTDITICKDIIHFVMKGFQSLKDSISFSLQSNSVTTNTLQLKLNLFNHIIHSIKETIFFIIRKKKARILKLLIEEFWDYLCIGSVDSLLSYLSGSYQFHSPMNSLFSDLTTLEKSAHNSSINIEPEKNQNKNYDVMKESIKFWCESMCLATSSSTLRIVGLILTPYITSIHALLYHFIRELHLTYVSTDIEQTYVKLPTKYEEILNYFTLYEPFLINPILRSDSTMLIYLLDMCVGSYQKTNTLLDQNNNSINSSHNSEIYQLQLYKNHIYHCLLTNWITLPSKTILYSIPTLCVPSLTSTIFQSPSPLPSPSSQKTSC